MAAPKLTLVGAPDPDPAAQVNPADLADINRRMARIEVEHDAIFAYLADVRTRPRHNPRHPGREAGQLARAMHQEVDR